MNNDGGAPWLLQCLCAAFLLKGYLMRLCDMNTGDTMRLEALSLPTPVKRRLMILGLTGDAEITLMKKKRRGAVIFKVRGVRYAVGRRIAEGIFVGGGHTDE